VEPRRELVSSEEETSSEASEMWSGIVEDGRYAEGRRWRRIGGGEGVSVNMMEGPGPSSVATLVIGTGLLENFGAEA
jgi:hypothetical protein